MVLQQMQLSVVLFMLPWTGFPQWTTSPLPHVLTEVQGFCPERDLQTVYPTGLSMVPSLSMCIVTHRQLANRNDCSLFQLQVAMQELDFAGKSSIVKELDTLAIQKKYNALIHNVHTHTHTRSLSLLYRGHIHSERY